MAFVRCMGGNGGGGTRPQFSETVILDNSAEATTFTFDEDYHDYDFLRFKTHNTNSGGYRYFICTPAAIDAAFAVATRVTFNEFNTNQYCTYSQSNLTWTRTNQRYLHIVEVVGINCANMEVEEVEIYKASSYNSNWVSISYDGDLSLFDMILVWGNSADKTEVLPCQIPIHGELDIPLEGGSASFMLNYYNAISLVSISPTSMGSFRYFYVSGIKFT